MASSNSSKISRSRRRACALVGLAVLVVVIAAVPAEAAGTLDQSQTLFGGGNTLTPPLDPFALQGLAQTFTAGITGKLDQVDIAASRAGETSGSLTVEIRATTGGDPSNIVVGSGSVAWADMNPFNAGAGWVSVPLAVPAVVTAGEQYAIVLTVNDGSSYFIATGGGYPGGQLYDLLQGIWYFQDGVDLAFKTYVTREGSPHCKHHCHY